MDVLYDVFPLILYFLGAVLLIVIIILFTKLLSTIDKVNILLDDVERKSQSLNGLFDAIASVGNTISSANNRVTSFAAKIVEKLFKRRKKRRKMEEEEYYE